MPESGLPIRVYKEQDMWHVDYGEGETEDHTSRENADRSRRGRTGRRAHRGRRGIRLVAMLTSLGQIRPCSADKVAE